MICLFGHVGICSDVTEALTGDIAGVLARRQLCRTEPFSSPPHSCSVKSISFLKNVLDEAIKMICFTKLQLVRIRLFNIPLKPEVHTDAGDLGDDHSHNC